MSYLLGSVTSVLTSVGYILLALLVLMVMIVIHESGHYLAGKLFKFKINEFSIGFGKAIFSRKMKSGETFSIRLIPLGGYCAFAGEDENAVHEGDFNSKPWWQRLIVLFSGAFFNFLSAIIFCVFLLTFASSGYSQITSVDSVVYEGTTEQLQVDDVILRVNGVKTRFLNGGFPTLIASASDTEPITLLVSRGGQDVEVVVRKHQIESTNENGEVVTDSSGNPVMVSVVGVTTTNYKYSFGKSLLMAVPVTCEMAVDVLAIIGKIFIGQYGLRDLGGPITTIGTIATASRNLINLLLLFPLISVNLAVFNWLPIPSLDGSRMVFVIIEAIRKKPIKREIEAKIHTVGLIALFALVIVVDVLHLFVFK